MWLWLSVAVISHRMEPQLFISRKAQNDLCAIYFPFITAIASTFQVKKIYICVTWLEQIHPVR